MNVQLSKQERKIFEKEEMNSSSFRKLLKTNYQKVFNYACSRGDLAKVRFIYCEYPQLNASEGFHFAALNGEIYVAKWLFGPYANVRTCQEDLLVHLVQEYGIQSKKYREMILFLYMNFHPCQKKFDDLFGPRYINTS